MKASSIDSDIALVRALHRGGMTNHLPLAFEEYCDAIGIEKEALCGKLDRDHLRVTIRKVFARTARSTGVSQGSLGRLFGVEPAVFAVGRMSKNDRRDDPDYIAALERIAAAALRGEL